MKIEKIITLASVITLFLVVSGCTTEAWYEGVKQSTENNCRNQPPSEVDRCLETLNKKSYDEYEKERSGQK